MAKFWRSKLWWLAGNIGCTIDKQTSTDKWNELFYDLRHGKGTALLVPSKQIVTHTENSEGDQFAVKVSSELAEQDARTKESAKVSNGADEDESTTNEQ